MKTLLAILLTLTLLAAALIGVGAQDTPVCDPPDPTCTQQCPRGGACAPVTHVTKTPPPQQNTARNQVQVVHIASAQVGWCAVEIFGEGRWWRVGDQQHPDGIQVYSDGHSAPLVADDPDPTHYRLTDCDAP